MSRQLEVYLAEIEQQLGGLPSHTRLDVIAEVREHLLALVAEQQRRGLAEDEAVAAALGQFGDARRIGRRLRQAHQPGSLGQATVTGLRWFGLATLVNVSALFFGGIPAGVVPELLYAVIGYLLLFWLIWIGPFVAGLATGITAASKGVIGAALSFTICAALFVCFVYVASSDPEEWLIMVRVVAPIGLPLACVGAALGGLWRARRVEQPQA